MDKTLQKLFPKFVSEIEKYPPTFHVLRPGASDKIIEQAEKKLKREFPAIYRQFLRAWNGGILFGSNVIIFAIYKDAKEMQKDDFPVEDLVASNSKKSSDLPANFLRIARTGSGEPIAVDLDHVSGDDVKVVRFSGGEVVATWKTFNKWLEYEMQLGRGVFDYKGNIR